MKKASSNKVILGGFIAILAMQICVMLAWYSGEHEHAQRLSGIATEQREHQLIFEIRDAAHKRALSLFHMVELEDRFARDREYMQFNAYANDFVSARDALLSHQVRGVQRDDNVRSLWERVRPTVAQGAAAQNEAAELFQAGRDSEGHHFLATVRPTQVAVMSVLTQMLEAADASVQKELARAEDASHTRSVMVFIFGGGALVAIFTIGALVMVRTAGAERLLVDQSQNMEKLKDQAESYSRAKSAFLANMSHEIRTPLTAIIGFSESLLDVATTQSERFNATQTVIRCGKHLLQVINDILDVSKIEAEKLHTEKLAVDVFQIIGEVCALASVQASDKAVEYSVDYKFPLPAVIESDPVRLKQILFNLVSNAIKFTHNGGVRVVVSFSTERKHLCFEIIDTGIGMNDAQKQHLFEAFSQADATTSRKYGGTGLGLHVSRTLCHKLGGDVKVESSEGVGSTFTVTIDTGPSAQTNLVLQVPRAVDKAPSIDINVKRSGSVLLADDIEENRQLASYYLHAIGATVTCAENGLHAVNCVQSNDFDLILMDIQMPVMDGLEATTLLRTRGYTKPIIALTANVMKPDLEKCIQSGCDDFLGKPINRTEFTTMVARYLKPRDRASNAPAGEASLPELRSSLLESEPELGELIAKFLDKLPGYVDELTGLCQGRKWFELARRLHDFKSMSGNYGFPQISELAAQAEREIRSERFDVLTKVIEQISTTSARACPKWIPAPNQAATLH